MGQSPADSDCGTSSPASAVEKNAHRRFPRLMLPEQSEMNGPIVDAQAQLNRAVSAHAQWRAYGTSRIFGPERDDLRLTLVHPSWQPPCAETGRDRELSPRRKQQYAPLIEDRRVLDSIRSSFRTIRVRESMLRREP